jgi:dephospho-CoA kinase
MRTLIVTVTGQTAVGKTTVAAIIEEALVAHGFKVSNTDIDVVLVSNNPQCQDQRIKALTDDGCEVTICTEQKR